MLGGFHPDAARLVENPQALCWSLTDLSWAASWQGEADTAILAGEESVDVARALGAGYHAAAAHCSLATAYLDAGQPERCAPRKRSRRA